MTQDISNLKTNSPQTFIKDNQVIFKIEEIPTSLNLLDYWQFKNTIKKSIIGTTLKSFRVVNYLVFLYTVDRSAKYKKILLTSKIDFLRTIIKDEITSELWILNDKGFLCIGIVMGVPFFIRSFSSVYEVNDNLELMIDSLDVFYTTQSVRFFNCSQNDIQVKGLNISEYSEGFMVDQMGGQTSVEQYVKSAPSSGVLNFATAKTGLIIVLSYVLAGISYHMKYTLLNRAHGLQSELASLVYKDIPDIRHYTSIMKLIHGT